MIRDFETIRFEDIHPAEYNPRFISDEEYSKLTNSINRWSLVDPIIINTKTNTIIGGHQRFKVLTEEYMNNPTKYEELPILKLGDIGWIFIDEDLKLENENDIKALNIALNRITGEWDYPKLNLLIDDLLDDTSFDIDLTGFDMLDMKDLNIDPSKIGNFTETEEDIEFDNETRKNYNLIIKCKTTDELNHLYSELDNEGYKLQVK